MKITESESSAEILAKSRQCLFLELGTSKMPFFEPKSMTEVSHYGES